MCHYIRMYKYTYLKLLACKRKFTAVADGMLRVTQNNLILQFF